MSTYCEEFLSLQPMFPPKCFYKFSPEGGRSEGLDAPRFFLNIRVFITEHYKWMLNNMGARYNWSMGLPDE